MEDIKEITRYLEGAKTLEAAVFTQKSIIEKLQSKLNSIDFSEKKLVEPQKPVPKSPIDSLGTIFKILSTGILIPGLLYGLWFFHFIRIPWLATRAEFAITTALAIVASAIITFALIRKRTIHTSNSHSKALKEYVKQMKKYEEDLVFEEKRLKNLEEEKRYINDELTELIKTYEGTKESLKGYYNRSSLIDPKYHNLVAVTQLYEYLDSDMCTSLSGAYGAYNLFDSEIEANNIIGDFDVILNSTEKIKYSQHELYIELEKSAYITEKIVKCVIDAASSIDSEEGVSAIDEFNTQIIAIGL